MKNIKRLKLASKGNNHVFSVLSEQMKNLPVPYPGNITTDHRRVKKIYSQLHPKFYMFYVNYQHLYTDKLQKMVNDFLKEVAPLAVCLKKYIWRKLTVDKVSKKQAHAAIEKINSHVEVFIKKLPTICHYCMLDYSDNGEEKPEKFLLLDLEGYRQQLENITVPYSDIEAIPRENKNVWELNPLFSYTLLAELTYVDPTDFIDYYEEVSKQQHPKVKGDLFTWVMKVKNSYMQAIGGEKARWDTLQSPFTMEKRSKDKDSDYKLHLEILKVFDQISSIAVRGQFYLKMDKVLSSEKIKLLEKRLLNTFEEINSIYDDLLNSATLSGSVKFFSELISYSRLMFKKALVRLCVLVNELYTPIVRSAVSEISKISSDSSYNYRELTKHLLPQDKCPDEIEALKEQLDIIEERDYGELKEELLNNLNVNLLKLKIIISKLGHLPYSVHNHHRHINLEY